jgi:perosamine synthetase
MYSVKMQDDIEPAIVKSSDRIPVAGPWITEREVSYVADAARNAWYENHGVYNRRFEEAVAGYVGVRHAVSLPHCTAGIHLALAALGVGAGDEVIVPDVTWIASVAPVTYVGAEPVFADIRTDTWCIDVDAIEASITPKTRAIIAVDLYGGMCEWDALAEVAARHGLFLIDDAAEAFGSEHNGRRAGAFGQAGVFSFHGSKTVATGEGGMLVTDDSKLHQRVLELRDHGRPLGDRLFLNDEIAFKYRMNAVTAALGLAQVERIGELLTKKRQIFSWYSERLSGHQGLSLNVEPPHTFNTYWMVTMIVDPTFGLDKFAVMRALAERNIDSRPFFTPLSELPAFATRKAASRFLPENPKGHAIARYGVNLPSGYNLTEEAVDIVCRAVVEIMRRGTTARTAIR